MVNNIIHYSSFEQFVSENELFRSDFDVKFFQDKNILAGMNGEIATYTNFVPSFVINLPEYLFTEDDNGETANGGGLQ